MKKNTDKENTETNIAEFNDLIETSQSFCNKISPIALEIYKSFIASGGSENYESINDCIFNSFLIAQKFIKIGNVFSDGVTFCKHEKYMDYFESVCENLRKKLGSCDYDISEVMRIFKFIVNE